AGINRGGYWILMVAVMSLHLNKEKSHSVIAIYALSTAAMSCVSLIDYFHVVDVPRFNEVYAEFLLDPKTSMKVGTSITGPFVSRSFLGPYLALAWPVPLMELIHGRSKNPLKIALWAGALVVLTLTIMLDYSRALYLTIGFAGLYALYTTDLRKMLRILLVVVPLFAIFSMVVMHKFPHEVEVLVSRVTSLGSGSATESGVFWRVETLEKTVNELLGNPQGMGFTKVVVGEARLEMHSIFTEHLRPAGLLGLLLVALFMWPVLRSMIRRRVPMETMVLCAALLGALAYGLAHSTQNMLVGWVVIGLLYYLSSQPNAVKPLQNPRLGTIDGSEIWVARRP
ncbi:MAG: hypothetical protein KJ749_02670, partial [Planctomycetes bacterium]|nr:hypothetical protein [Planctomycetota bacterium]